MIILARGGQSTRLRELVETCAAIEPDLQVTADPAALAKAEPGSLVVLALREVTLDWLNLNRPLFSTRSLRVVLWAEGELDVKLRFLAPDLHDWISHFVTCPPGVPTFVRAGLEQGLNWWPGVAWTGTGLQRALEEVLGRDALELSPDTHYPGLVEALTAGSQSCVIWRGVETLTGLWRLRWALAEARHRGPSVLDNPGIRAPGFYRVRAEVMALDEVLERFGDESLRRAALVEFEPGALEFDAKHSGPPTEVELERVGLLRGVGPAMRSLHESEEVKLWRKRRIAQLQQRVADRRGWARDEQALFASLARDRKTWPDWASLSWLPFRCEHALRAGSAAQLSANMTLQAARFRQRDVLDHWSARWPSSATHAGIERTQRALDAPLSLPKGQAEVSESLDGLIDSIAVAEDEGWEHLHSLRALIVGAVLLGDHAPDRLPQLLDRAQRSAREQLGETDPQYSFILRILGLAAARAGALDLAARYFAPVLAIRDPASLWVVRLEWSVVAAMRGQAERALELFSAPSAVGDPMVRADFARFHWLTRALLGQVGRDDLVELLEPGEPVHDAMERIGGQLLRARLMALGNITQ